MSALPRDWREVSLGELGKWIGGGTPSKANPLFWTKGTVPWVSPKDMKTPRISDAKDHITPKAIEQSATNLVGPGSILVVVRSGILKHTFPIAITDRAVALNQDLKALSPRDGINAEYLALALRAFERDILHKCSKNGVTVQSIMLPSFLRFRIPIAPPAEQKRIVAEIEKQFTRLDAGLAALQRVQANLRRYHDAILKSACEGRLVPPEASLARTAGRTYEPGHALLKRLGVHGPKNRTIAPPDSNAANLYSLPTGWVWTTLDSIANVKGGITKDQKRKHAPKAREVPYLRVANVQRGYLDLSEMKNIKASEDEIADLRLKHGDILLNEGGDRDKLGRGWVWSSELPECIHQNHVFRARLHLADLSPKYVSWYANSFGQKFFFTQGKHTTNLASISMTKLRRLPIPLPPAAEQRRIVAEVERQMSSVKMLESVVAANLARGARLRQAILRKAFSGRI